jgi:YgiT-type zinc finger domain-containing protein
MKKLSNEYHYGNCHICGERMTERRVKQDFWIKGKLIVLDGVPAGVCPRCGERVVRAEVGRTVAELLANQRRKRRSRTLNVPVILFDEQVA